MDDCMAFTDNDNKTKIMSYVLATPGAMKRYMSQNTVVYVQDINDGKVGRRYLVGGEVTGEAIHYVTDEEKNFTLNVMWNY